MATKKTTTKTEKIITGFKGFDKNLKCRDKQYKLETEETEQMPQQQVKAYPQPSVWKAKPKE